MSEQFDILNPNGTFTNQVASRDQSHRDGLWHRAVVVFVVDPGNRRVLLQKRSQQKKTWPGLWDVTSGGHVDAGEFGYQAALREAKEEIGLDAQPEDLLCIGTCTSESNFPGICDHHFNEYYVVHRNLDPTTVKLQTEEVEDLQWFDKEEIRRRLEHNCEGITNKTGCWEYLLRYLDSVGQ